MVKVLFVCMGNICRSPMAQGAFEAAVRSAGLQREIAVDSAGTHAYHVGEPPDPRARAAARQRGLDIEGQRARQIHVRDIHECDRVLVMDRDNLRRVLELVPREDRAARERIRLLMSYAEGYGDEDEVDDPYYGGDQGFEEALDRVQAAARGLLDEICTSYGLTPRSAP